jgi:hypothetical protein
MIKYFLSSSFIFISLFSFCQNFATVYPDKKALYVNLNWGSGYTCTSDSYVGIAIDSTKIISGNTIYYHFNILRRTPEAVDCNYLKKFPNWTGSKTIVKNNGENVFLTNSGDSIRINSKADVNDKWHFCDLPNGDYFEAILISKFSGTILTAQDSIKLITLTLKDNLGSPLAHNFNGKQLALSKNYGMLKGYDFSRFPNDTSAFILSGISNPDLGTQDITAREVFNYNMGDEFHIEDNYSYIPYNGTFKKERRIVLAKTTSLNQDTLTYQIERIVITHYYNYQANTHDSSAVKDTIIEKDVISEFPNLNMMTSKLESAPLGFITIYCLNKSGYNNRLVKSQSQQFNPNNDPCFDDVFSTGISSSYYLEGLGAYYETDNFFPNQNSRTLIYYKKGSETFGTPINFDLLLSIQSKNKPQIFTSVYPNPFSDFTVLKINNTNTQTYELMLMDIYGKIVREYSFNEDQLIIQNDGNLKGLYIYKLFNDKNEIGTGKLIIY